jgi:hypothetical protein
MHTEILKGSRDEIAKTFAEINGQIHEVIVFVDDASDSPPQLSMSDVFAEMEPFTVHIGGAEYARQSLYNPMEGE